MSDTGDNRFRVAIVGAGFGGICMGVELKRAGIEDFVILERGDDVGGTWRANTYPGCQCDVPSHLYSLSFAPNPDWSRTYSRQPEIWDYLRRCAADFGLMPHIRFGCEVAAAAWQEGEGRWRLETSGGSVEADVAVGAMGGLSAPKIPDIPGLGDFRGPAFHTAEWRSDVALAGKRVAVIGTGASAIQVVPRIQPEVSELHVYQRTPPWVIPHTDRPIPGWERTLYRAFPPVQKLVRGGIYALRELMVLGLAKERRLLRIPERLARRHLKRQVSDPELRRRLTPDYELGCKRVLISNDYYPALTQPAVELVTDGIREVRPGSIVSADGREREVDAIILGTGFHVSDMPFADLVRGRDGATLAERWNGSPQAYLGISVAGFPNLFLLMGPNTGLGHTSIVYMIESQVAHIIECLRAMDTHGAAIADVRPEAQARFNDHVQRGLRGTVWNAGGCASWYLDEHGRNGTIWPGFTFSYRRLVRRFDPADYRLEPAPEPQPA